MSKLGETKMKILGSLKHKSKTLTDLSEELNLAPSTVSQHIQELLDLGAIQEQGGDIQRKWKYYEVNPAFDLSTYNVSFFQRHGMVVPIAAIVVAAIVVFAYLALVRAPQPITYVSAPLKCSATGNFTCGSPTVTSGGQLSLQVGGFSQAAQINGVACTYSSTLPTRFSHASISIPAKQLAIINFSCPAMQPGATQSSPVHIWLNYSTNGGPYEILQVAVITPPPVTINSTSTTSTSYTTYPTSISVTTVPGGTTTVPTTTIPYGIASNGTLLVNAVAPNSTSATVTLPKGYSDYICAVGTYLAPVGPASWQGYVNKNYSNIGEGYAYQKANNCTVKTYSPADIALSGVGINAVGSSLGIFESPEVYSNRTVLTYSTFKPNSRVIIMIATGGGSTVSGYTLPPGCTYLQQQQALGLGGWSPLSVAMSCNVTSPGNYQEIVYNPTGSGYFGNSYVSVAAFVFTPNTTTNYVGQVGFVLGTGLQGSGAPNSTVVFTINGQQVTWGQLMPLHGFYFYNVTSGENVSYSYSTYLIGRNYSLKFGSISQSNLTCDYAQSGTFRVGRIPTQPYTFCIDDAWYNPYNSTTTTTTTTATTTTIPQSCTTQIITMYKNQSVSCQLFSIVLASIVQQQNSTQILAQYYINFNGRYYGTVGLFQNSSTSVTVQNYTATINTYGMRNGPYYNNTWAQTKLSVSPSSPPPSSGCNVTATVYTGGSDVCSPFRVQLIDIGQPNSTGVSTALLNVYYNNATLSINNSMSPKHTAVFCTLSGCEGWTLSLYLNQTHPSLYSYQRWAQMQMKVSFNPGTTTTVTTTVTTTIPPQNGCNVTATVYLNRNDTCYPFRVQLINLGNPNANGTNPAYIRVFAPTNNSIGNFTVWPKHTYQFLSGQYTLNLYINQTNAQSLNSSMRWAQMQMIVQFSGTTTVGTTSTVSVSTSTIPQTCSTNVVTMYLGNTLYCNQYSINLASMSKASNGTIFANYRPYYYNTSYNSTISLTQNTSKAFAFAGRTMTIYSYNLNYSANVPLTGIWARTKFTIT